MKIDDCITWIDNASYEQLLQKNRFAPIGDLMMQGETGDYFIEMLRKRKAEVGHEAAVEASKRIGWTI